MSPMAVFYTWEIELEAPQLHAVPSFEPREGAPDRALCTASPPQTASRIKMKTSEKALFADQLDFYLELLQWKRPHDIFLVFFFH